MRYLVAVRGDLLLAEEKLVDGVLEAVMTGLADWGRRCPSRQCSHSPSGVERVHKPTARKSQ